MITEEFAPYELALELKQLGFDEPCLASYYHAGRILDICEYINHGEYTVLAPTYSQAFRFFREKYDLFVQPNRTVDPVGTWYYFSIEIKRKNRICQGSSVYEYAELACLKKLIEIIKNK